MKRLAAICVLAVCSASAPAIAQTPQTPQAPTTTTATMVEVEYLDPNSAQLEAMEERGIEAAEVPSGGGLMRSFLQMILMLGAVCVLAYLVLGKGLPRLLNLSASGKRSMIGAPSRGVVEVIDRLPLDPKRALLVVRVGKSHFLVGLSDQGMTLLSRLDEPSLENLESTPDQTGSFLGRFQGILKQRMDKEG